MPAEAAEHEKLAQEWGAEKRKREAAARRNERREHFDRRDGGLSRKQRLERFHAVVSQCGEDRACMRAMLGQDDAGPDDELIF